MEENKIESVYIHIPFCKKICTYCDFCKMYYNKKFINDYLDALKKEIISNYNNDKIKTIYIGGGTPSCLEKEDLEKLFSIIKIFKLNKNYEFTFECNVSDIDEDLLVFLKENKVNRLSIGIESFNPKLLKVMGRNIVDIDCKISLVKKYFNNINVDLIYGLNNETIEDLKSDLNKFLKLDVSHISIYSLILEDNTILKINNYEELDYDLQRDMYDLIIDTLSKNGYIHYEISNFSKKGYESKHNLTYWNNNEYYGFGLGSGGYVNGYRYTNTRSLNNYIKGNYKSEFYKVRLKEDMENYMILGLRKIKGISKHDFYKRYNKNINEVFNTSKLKENKNYFYIPKKYLYVSNEILIDFISN